MISIIVPVYNDKEHITWCLDSIYACNYKDQFEVIIVDDGSSDGLEEAVALFPCRFLRTEKNSGPGMARNLGAGLAKGEILAFVDSDCIVPKDWLAVIDNNFMDDRMQVIAGRFSKNLNPEFIARFRYYEASFYMLNEKTSVNTFTASSFACRKDLFLKAGGFGNRPAAEEITLGHRLYKMGHNISCVPEFVVAHYCLSTLKGYLKQQFIWMNNFFIVCQLHPEMLYFRGFLGKRNLIFQMLLQLLFIAGIAILLINNKALLVIPLFLVNLVCLFLLNLPFLRYIKREEGDNFSVLKSIFAIFTRNCAWTTAILCGMIPKRIIPFLYRVSFKNSRV
jgi:glycosyltransferase involved in cell wall biosynthesis